MFLYKYRRDSEYTETIFTTGKVRLSTPSQLNDPFEASMREINTDRIAEWTRQMKAAQLEGFVASALAAVSGNSTFFGLPADECRQLLAAIKTTQFDKAYKTYRDFITSQIGNPPSDPDVVFSGLERQLQRVGIFSLSEVADHQLLWAHYAEDHKGLCLGFEVIDGRPLANADHCLRVTYSDALPEMTDGFKQTITFSIDENQRLLSHGLVAFADPTFRAAISTKPPSWEYEREWRYVEPTAGDYPWPGPLIEIVFGLRCPPERRSHYLALAAEFVPNDVRIYEMRKVANSNSLQRIRIDLLATRFIERGTRPGYDY